MRWGLLLGILVAIAAPRTFAGSDADVLKVLPHFLDHQGRHTLSPSLYERDAYQARLRNSPGERGGLRFDVLWRAKSRPTGELKLRVETRSAVVGEPTQEHKFEQPLAWRSGRSRWAAVSLAGGAYEKFGELTAWRATLWDGDRQIAETKSFLW